MNVADATQKKATYLGGGLARWNFDQKEYALSPLTVALCAINDTPLSNLQGPKYWGRAGSGLSLADEARALDLEKGVALKANSGSLTGDHG